VVSVLVIFSSFFLNLFGEGFLSGVSVLLILCIGQLINSLSGSVGVIMQMIGEQKVYQNLIISALVINLVLTFLLTPLYGGIGAATATVVSMIFWNIAGAYYLKQKKKIITYFNPF
jgi:O-antigen/teichoic acid export membrane protein